jgi:hypothetical protein
MLVTTIIAVIGLTGCNKVYINPDDQTPPMVEIKVKGSDGQYSAASEVNMSVSQPSTLDIMCIVTDPDGVKSANLDFDPYVETCTIGDTPSSQAKYLYQPLPQDLFQSVGGDSSGKVLDEVPLLATLKGPFTCTFPGEPPGVPYGTTIKVFCDGSNWSSNTAKQSSERVLTIHLK